MTVRLVGSNSGLLLFSAEEKVAFASIWRVDWSERGSGESIVLLYDGGLRILGPDPELGRWLTNEFVRHFQEVKGMPWPEPEFTVAPVHTRLDLATGVTSTCADVRVEISGIMDRRLDTAEAFRLGEVTNHLSLLYAPCQIGILTIAGVRVAGEPRLDPSAHGLSSAYVTEAEVWSHTP